MNVKLAIICLMTSGKVESALIKLVTETIALVVACLCCMAALRLFEHPSCILSVLIYSSFF